MERVQYLLVTVLILVLGSTGPALAAKKTSKADVEDFVRSYVNGVVKNDLSQIAVDEKFKSALEDDSHELAECAKSSCKPVLRTPVKIKEYDEDEEDAPEEEMFEVHMDIYKSGKVHARRSGCYMVMKKSDHFVMREYQYDCAE